ncbi:hypothetical protein VOLCADRAFT_107237 [Volvox carteri f. nagariensis]|uniref:Uncharacterized protein n=1 Tax=Volvox carteri f. nagariensis TaxID=3068 RepID=D8UCS6_VOLCA|nr:uncharacterized protein VOLCADRAFT_107237 [Volvox carteri f. nagariensis]EFJ42394.1 hypothetical protein VOLCADRAFT_107237 [Volvox carteri f. nagariensis]|eukprot:XP_002956457.1 hypothetical protein VOLCADRAFT_107237 [Volvox carteri f. nagariensis]
MAADAAKCEVLIFGGAAREWKRLMLCDCGAFEDELHVFEECPAYKSIRAKYDGDLVLKGRSMRTIMTEAPPLALARYLSEIWEARHVALRRFTLKWTRENEDDLPCTRINTNTTSMAPPAFMDTPALVCGTCNL